MAAGVRLVLNWGLGLLLAALGWTSRASEQERSGRTFGRLLPELLDEEVELLSLEIGITSLSIALVTFG